MDAAGSHMEAVAWSGDRLIAVGDRASVRAAAGAGATVVDTGGAEVLPGFVDAHHHASLSALYGGVVRLCPPEVTDIPSLQAALSRSAEGLPPGAWLVAMEWDEQLLAERRAPTRQEVDDAVPDHPVFALHYSGHRALASSRALELAGIDRHTPDPSGGAIGRDRKGLPDGVLVERGMSRVESLARADRVVRDLDGILDRLAAHYRAMVAVGITRIADCTVPADLLDVYRRSAARGDVLFPTLALPVSATGWLEEPWDVFDGAPTGERDGPLTVGPVKLVFDGAPGCSMCLSLWQALGVTVRTARFALRVGSLDPVRASFSVSPRMGAKVRTGIAIYRRQEANAVIAAAVERGFAVATHAIGNEAVDVALSAYEATGAGVHGAGRARLEHAAFLERELVARIAGCGAAVVAQPYFLTLPAYANAVSIPGIRGFPLRWLLDAGVLLAGSSDYPVAGFDPLDGVRHAVHRRTTRGHVYEPDQRVSMDEALAMYTRGGAEACHALDESGTLEVGKRADLVVLDRPLRGEADLEAARVRATIVAGQVVHGDPAGA